MGVYNIGELVKEGRKRAGYTQEELSYGICTPSSLSKIENGVQEPTMEVFNALMQRIRMESEIYPVYSSKKEIHLLSLKREIIKNMVSYKENKEYVEELVEKYEKSVKGGSKIHRQSALYLRAICCIKKKEDTGEILDMLYEAIRISIPNFHEDNLEDFRLLTFDEIVIINNIAIIYHRIGKDIIAIKLLSQIIKYFDTNDIENEMIKKQCPVIFYNMGKFTSVQEKYDKAIKICNRGIDTCVKFDTYIVLPYLLKLRASILLKEGDKNNALQSIEKAYILFELQKNIDQLKKIDKIKKHIS